MSASRPNVLIIHTDEHVHTWLGCAGNAQIRTPHIDALAADGGLRFENAYTANGVCVPSRACLITGRYPIAHGVVTNSVKLSPHEMTMGKLFSEHGYVTGWFGKTHFGGNDKDMPGEGWQESYIRSQHYNATLEELGVEARYPEGSTIDTKVRYWQIGASNIPTEHYFENKMTDEALAFMRRHTEDPFLCMLSLLAPHGPFTPPKPYDTMYDPADLDIAPRFETELDNKPPAFVRWIEQNRKYVNDDELRIYLAHIYGLISLVDDNVGRLVAMLKEEGLYDETIIIFTSDHGDYGTRFGMFGKSWSANDAVMRVPLIISAPGQRGMARVTPALTDNTDILPTLLDAAGLPIPRKVQGTSLMPIVRGEADSTREAIFSHDQGEYTGDFLAMSMVREGDWKYVQAHSFKGELYNLADDPWEVHNLIDDPAQRERVIEMRERLLRWHVENAGAFYDVDKSRYWEDETAFYDETRFTGERLFKRDPNQQT